MSDECPTSVHHPLTVCQVCHPDEWARRQESVRAFSEAIAQTYDNLTSIDWPKRFRAAAEAPEVRRFTTLAGDLRTISERLALQQPAVVEAIVRALLGEEP